MCSSITVTDLCIAETRGLWYSFLPHSQKRKKSANHLLAYWPVLHLEQIHSHSRLGFSRMGYLALFNLTSSYPSGEVKYFTCISWLHSLLVLQRISKSHKPCLQSNLFSMYYKTDEFLRPRGQWHICTIESNQYTGRRVSSKTTFSVLFHLQLRNLSVVRMRNKNYRCYRSHYLYLHR